MSEKEGFVIPGYLIELLKSGAERSVINSLFRPKPLTPKQKRRHWRAERKRVIGEKIYRVSNWFGYYHDCDGY